MRASGGPAIPSMQSGAHATLASKRQCLAHHAIAVTSCVKAWCKLNQVHSLLPDCVLPSYPGQLLSLLTWWWSRKTVVVSALFALHTGRHRTGIKQTTTVDWHNILILRLISNRAEEFELLSSSTERSRSRSTPDLLSYTSPPQRDARLLPAQPAGYHLGYRPYR